MVQKAAQHYESKHLIMMVVKKAAQTTPQACGAPSSSGARGRGAHCGACPRGWRAFRARLSLATGLRKVPEPQVATLACKPPRLARAPGQHKQANNLASPRPPTAAGLLRTQPDSCRPPRHSTQQPWCLNSRTKWPTRPLETWELLPRVGCVICQKDTDSREHGR